MNVPISRGNKAADGGRTTQKEVQRLDKKLSSPIRIIISQETGVL